MARNQSTPVDKGVSSLSNDELQENLGSSGNAREPSNRNEHGETVVPNSNSEAVVRSAGETGHIAETNDDPIPPKSDKGTMRKRQMRAMIDIISKDHGK